MLKGFGSAIDHYMSKPFSTKELAARIKALMRRSGVPESDLLEACGIQIDLGSHRLIIQGTNIHIGPTEYRLLVQLLDHIWGRSSYIEIRTVDVHMLRLRKKTRAYWSGRNDPDRAQRGLSLHAGLLTRLGSAKTLTQVRYSLASFKTAVCTEHIADVLPAAPVLNSVLPPLHPSAAFTFWKGDRIV